MKFNFNPQWFPEEYRSFIIRIQNSDFAKNVSTLMIGSIIAHGIAFISSPILSRVFLPQDFAILAIFVQLAGIFSSVASLKLELALPIAREDNETKHLFNGILIIILTLSLLFIPSWLIGGQYILDLFKQNNSPIIFMFLPICFVFSALNRAMYYLMTRYKLYKDQRNEKILNRSSNFLFALLFGKLSFAYGLTFGYLMSTIAGTAYYYFKQKNIFILCIKAFNFKQSIKQILINRDYIIFDTPKSILTQMQTILITIVIAQFYDSITLGLYSFSFKIVQIPTTFFAIAVSQVFLQFISDANKRNKNIYEIFLKNLKRLAIIGFAPFLFLFILGEESFKIIFGPKWHLAGLYVEILAPWMFIKFLKVPASQLIYIVKKQKVFFFISLFENLIILSLFFVCAKLSLSFLSLLKLLNITGTILVGSSLIYLIFEVKKFSENKIISNGK